MGQHGFYVINNMYGLCEDETIEAVGRNAVGPAEVCYDGCRFVCRVDVEDFADLYTVVTKIGCIAGIMDLKHTPVNIRAIPVEKAVDAIAVDRGPSFAPPTVA